MAVENPPLNRIYVLGYSANDRDYPIVSLNADPRVAGYRVPEDLSTCPDKRYPNHVFTGAQPISGDERVRHVWELLPSPYVPFTRYDDDLGPVQGRRRSVKNEGQVASRETDKQITYDAREGSAIVYTELEETWSIATDDDGNSLFPIRDRDFYDPSRGPVQERRQLLVPTGEEEGSLENVNGVITQTSYEPYNDFLSVKVVQTYKVDGPQLVGNTTDNDGQLITVTTQRKGANGYVPPNPTATRTVEVSREDAEALIERIVDTPEIFKANTFSVERPDPIPQKFRVAVPIQSSQEIVEGDAEVPTLEEGEISKSEEQRNKFIKRVSSTSRDQAVLPQTLTGKSTNNERQEVTVTETLQLGNTNETPTATKTVESEALGDGNYVITKTEVDELFAGESYQKTKADLTPQKFRASQEDTTSEQTIEGIANANIILAEGEFSKSEQQINKFVKRISTTSRAVSESEILSESVLTPEGLLATRTLVLAKGAQSFTPSATLVDANVEALGDGRTVKTETTIPTIFGARSVSVERPDSTPAKFRALVPSKTDQLNVVGSVDSSITLADGEVAKSETQQTQFVKRVVSSVRDQAVLPQTLTQKTTSEDRQVATVTETLQTSDTVEAPTATRTIESEAIGDGNYVVRKTEVPEVFGATTFSKERPDPVPQKFRVAVPSLTEQETLEGQAEEPSLTTGEISKSEQQVNKFVKRVSTTTRNETSLPQSLTQKTTSNDGLLATVSETLQSGDTEEEPTATRSVQSEALGDGTYVVTITDLPKVFSGQTYSVERPDPLPQKFRVAARTLTSQQTIEGSANPNINLISGQLSKSEQQVTDFVKRTSLTSRDQTQLPVTLVQRAVDNDRQSVTVTETLQNAETIEPNSATVTIQSEALGDGNFLVTKSEVPEVFGSQIYRKTREDLTPQKFKAAQEDSTVEQNVGGTASSDIALATGEFAKSEQQVNKFVKRVSTTSRSTTVSPAPLVESVLTNEGQVGTRTLTLASGQQSFTPSATLVDANVEALGDGRTVKTEVRVPRIFANKTITKTKIDLTPEKFKARQEDTTTEESVTGTIATNLSLSSGEFKKSEQQVTEFVKRTSTTLRDTTATTNLEEFIITPQGQLAKRTLILSSGSQTIQPEAKLIDGSIEELGDGRTIKTEVRVPSLFANKSIQKTKADLTPQKFRAAQEDTITEETVEGTINPNITLSTGEFNKSEQQITEFTKRTSTNVRNIEVATEPLVETVITPQGQIATRTLILSAQEQSIDPDALLVDGSIEALGDGRTVKSETKVEEVFPQTLRRVEKPVTIPERFLTSNFTTTEAETLADESPSVQINGNIISQQVERTGVFTARKTTTERDLRPSASLSGADYDEVSNAQIPFTETIATSVPSGPCEADPLGGGRILVKQYDTSKIETNLNSVMLSFPTRSSIGGIPPVLKKLEVEYEKSKGTSDSDASGNGFTEGNTGSVSVQGSSQAKASVSCIPKFIVELEEVNAVNVPTTSYFFFLKYPVTLASILNKVNALQWPVFKPKSYTITATGQTVTGSLSLNQDRQRSFASESNSYSQSSGKGNSTETSNQIIVLNIPPCVHGGFSKNETITEETTIAAQVVINLSTGTTQDVPPIIGTPAILPLKAEAKVQYSLTATSVNSVPTTGKYLINSNVQPYKFGFAKVYAEVVDASIFA